MENYKGLQSVVWAGDHLDLLDQRLLPEEVVHLPLTTGQDVWEAIRHLKVRGAPAIGIAAAYGVFLGSRSESTKAEWLDAVNQVSAHLATSRPTAVNLFWALDRMRARAKELEASGLNLEACKEALLDEAKAIQSEDEETCRMIGEHALGLFEDGMGVLTHCNAGSLATAKYGTALAPFYLALEQGIKLRVFADETRPVLQGARLTAFELQQ
ncbi:S-methyl-5-thioribose-1-phosphate isomerase, partial [Paenibacillus sepulcri]|nr:S-methyl-5-thioribose-1-phosphate isomerase [Paenibacillus sepulcri]